MKPFVRSIPMILFSSVATFSLIAFVGCSDSSGGATPPHGSGAATSAYGLEYNEVAGVDQDSVVVFSASATGTTTPTSTLTLPSGFDAYSLAVGPNGEIYVGGEVDSEDNDQGEILKYAAGASGTATPAVTLNGGGTGTFDYPDNLAVNSAGTLVVSADDYSIEAFAAGFTASSAPTQYLTWGQDNFGDDGDYLAVDTAGEIFYMDDDYEVVDVFAAGATGATAPVRTITATNTNSFDELEAIAVDGAGDVYLANYNEADDTNQSEAQPGSHATHRRGRGGMARAANRLTAHPHEPESNLEPTEIIEFAAGAGANGNTTPTPTKRIGGGGATTNLTNIVEPLEIAVDAAGNLYEADANGGGSNLLLLEVFSPSATGNVAPAASISVSGFTEESSEAFAIH